MSQIIILAGASDFADPVEMEVIARELTDICDLQNSVQDTVHRISAFIYWTNKIHSRPIDGLLWCSLANLQRFVSTTIAIWSLSLWI
jgi:hypothetical protein